MKRFKQINCPICDTNEYEYLFTKEDENFVQCKGCGLIYINPQPIQESLMDTYDENYAELYINKAKSKYRRSKNRVKRLLKKHKNAKRFLDIGCSAGFVVKAAKDLGLEAYGVEIEKTGPKYAKEVLGLENIYNGFLEEAKYPDKFFDIITFYEVLEHIPDLKKFLAEVYRIAKDDAIIQISVPNAGHWSLRKKEKLKEWNAILPSEHLWYFSPKTIKMLLEKNSFEIICINPSFWKPGMKVTFRKNL